MTTPALRPMQAGDRVFVAGHAGLVGSAITRRLQALGYGQALVRKRSELDLTDQAAVERYFATERPQYVFLAAARVGGILANNSYPADFIRENLRIQTNVIDASWRHGVEKLCFLGSSCIYPRLAPQPMRESCLMSGPLEPTNEWYAIAKLAGIRMCQAYAKQHGFRAISLLPSNLYGPGDNFNLETSHVLPALIRRSHESRERGDARLTIWGTGTPRREFLHVDDLADACVFLMQHYESEQPINVGVGSDLTIRELAELIAGVVGFAGQLEFDPGKPDGTPRKLLDIERLTALGWHPRVALRDGIEATYRWYLQHLADARA